MLTLNHTQHHATLDAVVEHYEEARLRDPSISVRDFLPASDRDDERRIAIELLCVDMDLHWSGPKRRRLAEYCAEFPQWLSATGGLQELAFEEYRLRRLSGENVRAHEYQQRFKIDVSQWPAVAPDTMVTDSDDTGIELIQDEINRMTDALALFPTEGQNFAGFELSEEIGHGALSVVYRAKQLDLSGREVVLKFTAPNAVEPDFLARLQHTNIVPIYSLHRRDGLQAICMPYFGRRTLEQWLDAAERPAPAEHPEEVARLILALTQGLQHAHQRGIVHRDLKPANILLADDDTPMLLDFNLSDDVVSGGRSSVLVGGTLPYMAPEHLRAMLAGKSVGAAADIFSLGVIFYQLLTGRQPFPQRRGPFAHTIAQLANDREQPVADVRQFNPRVSPGLASIVQRMIAPIATDRYASAAQVGEDLARHLEHKPLSHAHGESWRERCRKWTRRHPRLASGSTVAVVGCVVLFALAAGARWRMTESQRRIALADLNDSRRQVAQAAALSSIPDADRTTLAAGIEASTAVGRRFDVMGEEGAIADRIPAGLGAGLKSNERVELRQLLVRNFYALATAQSQLARHSQGAEVDDRIQVALQANRMAQSLADDSSAMAWLGRQQARIEAVVRGTSRSEADDVLELPISADVSLEATSRLQERQYEQAIVPLEQLRDRDPHDASHWLLLGNAYVGAGRLSEAEGCFSVCTALWPDSYLGPFYRGLCRSGMERYEEAERDFDLALERRPDFVPALINRAVVRTRLGRDADAEQDLTRAIRQGAVPTRVYFLRSAVRRRLGDMAGAQADQQQGLQMTPRDEPSWIERGLARLQADPRGALADFEAATERNPRSHSAWRNIAHVYAERLSEPGRAIPIFDRLLGWNSADGGDRISRGVLYARMGDRDRAHADAQQVLDANPSAKELFQLGCLYSLTSAQFPGDATRAVALIEKAITLEPRWLSIAIRDSDLQPIREQPEFQEVLRAANERAARDRALLQDAEPAAKRES